MKYMLEAAVATATQQQQQIAADTMTMRRQMAEMQARLLAAESSSQCPAPDKQRCDDRVKNVSPRRGRQKAKVR